MEDAPQEKGVDVVPSGKRISHKMTAYLEEVAKKKRSGENLLQEGKRMRLASLTPSVLDSTVRARDAYIAWHEALFAHETVLPVSADKLRAFCKSLSDMGYSYHTIVSMYFSGVCSWHLCNDLPSPRQAFPSLSTSIKRYLLHTTDTRGRFNREPIMPQDVEHLIDTCGIETPHQLQMAFFCSVSFHTGCRQGSLTIGHKRGLAEQLKEDLLPDDALEQPTMTLDQLSFRKDENEQLLCTVTFNKEKQDAINKSHRRPFVLTPLKKGSPYDAATLGFLLLAVRGAFLLEPKAAFTTGNFQLKEEARKWPVMCHIDKASGTIHGMATTFIINECIRNSGVFPRESVATLCRLAGWSEKSGTWAIYIKEVFERHLDGNAFLYRDLRADSEKTTYLKKVKSHYNFRLIPPEKNLVTKEDCEEVNGFEEYLDRYEDQTLGCTITEAKRALREINEKKQERALGMSKASITRRLATVTNRAVAQFAAEKNAAAHDRQWGKSIAPHPDKEEFKEPLNILQYLERRKPSVQLDKLSLRRFSPADYAMPLEEPVRCPYGSCNFETWSGDAMSAHQQGTKHPGWQRYGERPSERSWVCQAKGCHSTFHQWNGLYNHMLGHSQPLSCPECSFRTGRGSRLSEHIKKVHPNSHIPSGHFLKQANSPFLKL